MYIGQALCFVLGAWPTCMMISCSWLFAFDGISVCRSLARVGLDESVSNILYYR